MSCGHAHEVAEGADLGRVACPRCGAPHDRMVQLRAADLEPFLRRMRRLKLDALARP